MLSLPSLKPSSLSSSESRFFPSISQPSAFSSLRYKWRSEGLRQRRTLVQALDAAQAYDYEARMTLELERKSKLKIAVVGFGNFGQFIAKTLVRQGHTVLGHSRSDYSSVAKELGVAFFSDAHDLCEEHPEVVLLCTSIISTEAVLRSLPLQRLKRSTLFVDVLSVKEFPRRLFLQILPSEFDILCTHPMFGPESGKNGWANLPFVYEKTRIGNEDARAERCDRFLEIFASEGCRMVEMSCAEHDRHAAETQFITHTVGRMLGRLHLQSTPINTKGYETLLNLVENTCGDSFDLYYGLFMYNVNATEQIERLEMAFDSLKKELFGHLHDILRRQIFDGDMGRVDGFPKKMVPALPENGYAKESKNVQEADFSVRKLLFGRLRGSVNGTENSNLMDNNSLRSFCFISKKHDGRIHVIASLVMQ